MAPIKVGYFQCTNAAPIICYPMILSAKQGDSGQALWDGRKVSGFSYELLVNQSVVVNLKATGIAPGTLFLIGEDTVAGVDRYASAPEFEYDPGSTNMVCGTRWGAIYNGSFTWDGCKDTGSAPFAPQAVQTAMTDDLHRTAAAYVHEAMRQFGRPTDAVEGLVNNAFPETRVVPWADGSDLHTINLGIASIISDLLIKGYNYDYETHMEESGKAATIFTFGPSVDPATKLVADWKAAVVKANVSAIDRETLFMGPEVEEVKVTERATTPPSTIPVA